MRKKRVLFLTDYAGAFTGFGKQCKLLLSYLYKTGKYEITNLAQGGRQISQDFDSESGLDKFPWKTIGTVPMYDQAIQNKMMQDPGFARNVSYGAVTLQSVVKKIQPDVIFAINDTWGSQFITDMTFFSKIPSVCWNTFDSLPLLEETIQKANQIKNYWTWSQFATDALHKKGFTHVKTQYPLVNTDQFYRLTNKKISSIKTKHGIPEDSFIIGFVFRNQLRKLINTQIEAYALFKKAHPEIKNTFLYTHTHYSEGWNIPKLCQQYGVDPKEVLCTYICAETREYFIKPFSGQKLVNPKTGRPSLITSDAEIGITDQDLNEIYNLFSVYSHPATSGACELPCVEAALTEKIILTCAYSFGEDIIKNNRGSMPMEFSFYTEHQTHFLKSQPDPKALSDLFYRVFSLEKSEKQALEKLSKDWAVSNYSIETNGSKIAKFIDDCQLIDFENIDLESTEVKADPNAKIPPAENHVEWLKSMYKLILDREVRDDDEGLLHWIEKLKQQVPPQDIEAYFRKVAMDEINKKNRTLLVDVLDKDDSGKRLLVILNGSTAETFYSTSLFESIKENYPEYNIYVSATQENSVILSGNKYIHKLIPFTDEMSNIRWLENKAPDGRDLFEVVLPLNQCYKLGLHSHNQKDKIEISLK